MDLIAQLIKNKKQEYDVFERLNMILDEIIKYEKLSKSPKFKNIKDTPLLQKQLPVIWSCFCNDTINISIFTQAISIVQAISAEPLQIFEDFNQHYTDKEKRNFNIIGNSNNIKYHYHQLAELPSTFDFDDSAIYLTNKIDDIEYFTVIKQKNNYINIYQGTINIDYVVEDTKTVYSPYITKKESLELIIYTYSILGNNNYPFATIRDDSRLYDVSMPSNKSIKYGNIEHNFTNEEQVAYELAKTNIANFADFIMKTYEKIR